MSAKPLPYTPVVRAGEFLFISGQIGLRDGALVEGGFEAEVKQALANLRSVVESQGATIQNVVKATVFVTNMDDFGPMNDLYEDFFEGHLPARATVAVAALPKGALFEIEAIAHVQ